jgi:hypothetical protein
MVSLHLPGGPGAIVVTGSFTQLPSSTAPTTRAGVPHRGLGLLLPSQVGQGAFPGLFAALPRSDRLSPTLRLTPSCRVHNTLRSIHPFRPALAAPDRPDARHF